MTGSRVLLLGFVAVSLAACNNDSRPTSGPPPPPPQPDVCVGPLPTPALEVDGEPVAFVGATVLVTPTDVREDQTVVVQGDRITAVGDADDVTPPAEAVVIDASCRFLMAGLIDMHVHFNFTENFLLYVANGITTVREMWGSTGRLVARQEIEDGQSDLIAPRWVQASRGIDGDPPIFPGARLFTNDPETAKGFVDQQIAEGYDFIKAYERLLPEVHAAILERAAEIGVDVAGHTPIQTGVDQVIDSDQVSIEHLDDYYTLLVPEGGQQRWWDGPIDPVKQQALVERLRDDGVWNVPTLNIVPALRTPAEIAAFDAATEELRFILPDEIRVWDQQTLSAGLDPSVKGPALVNMRRFLGALSAVGANLMLGTDAGFARIIHGFAIHDEARMMVQSGMTPVQVLEAATVNPARFLNQEGEIGSVRVGLRADLILLDEDPRDDIGNLRARAGVMLRGRWFSEARLQELLEALAAEIATMAPSPSLGPTGAHAHGPPR